MSIHLARVVELPRVTDVRGNLTFLEEERHAPFPIRRVYYLYDVPGGASRGGHAHRQLKQMLIAVSGSFDVHLDDGFERKSITLNRSYQALFIPTRIWRELHNFSSGGVCLSLASEHYSEEDYVRDHTEFLGWVRGEPQLRLVPYDRRFLAASREWLREPETKALTRSPDFTDEGQEAWFAGLSGRSDYVIFGVALGDRPVGVTGLKHITATEAEWFAYLGAKDLWGGGWGGHLTDLAIADARLRGLQRLNIKVWQQNERGLRAFRKKGFADVGREGEDLLLSLPLGQAPRPA